MPTTSLPEVPAPVRKAQGLIVEAGEAVEAMKPLGLRPGLEVDLDDIAGALATANAAITAAFIDPLVFDLVEKYPEKD